MTNRGVRLLAPIALAAIAMTWAPGALALQDRLYIANDDHTDYMWSTDEDRYGDIFVDMLDYHLDLADRTADLPDAYRNRFNTDGSLWLWEYERRKGPVAFARLMARVKDGTISSPLNTLVSTYGAQPAEAVLRGLYYAGRLERRFDVRFQMANATENQTLPLGLASLFAGAGARYSWRGVCGCASHISNKLLGDRPSEVYWYRGHDGEGQLMKWYSLGRFGIGGYWEAGFPEKAMALVGEDPGFRRRHADPATGEPYRVTGLFGYGGDDLARKTGVAPPPPIVAVPGLQGVPSNAFTPHFHELAQRYTTRDRQVVVSNELDYFADFERRYGAGLPSQTVTYGNEWDLYSASMAETSARVKRAVEKMRAAELLATLVSLHYPAFMDQHRGARDRAFMDLGLYWEHDWTADGPVSRGQRAAWQEKLASSIDYYVNGLFAEGIVRLGGMMPRPSKEARRFFVLNPLGWDRDDIADYPYAGSADIHVLDLTTGREVPHQILERDGQRLLRILASGVPSAGYKTFEIAAGPGKTRWTQAARATDGIVDNGQVRLQVAPDGAITSFRDLSLGTGELAAEIDGRALNDLAPGSAEGDALQVEDAGPVSITLRASSRAGLPHRTRITLYRDSRRIDIENEITANFTDNRYWGFSFALPDPDIRSEEVGAVNYNELKSKGGDYADTHARYDHITLNHFADITSGDGKRGVTLSNPDLAFARLGRSTITALDTATPQINVLGGGQVDGSALGIRGQNGARYFLQRFALRAHGGYDQPAAMRMALEHQNPLIAGAIISKPEQADAAAYPQSSFSLVGVDDPAVMLWALKPADDGIDKGVVARLWNLAGQPRQTAVHWTRGVAAAWRTSHVETDLEPAPVAGDAVMAGFRPQQLQTYRLIPASRGAEPGK
jgi:alpha-mannosidase